MGLQFTNVKNVVVTGALKATQFPQMKDAALFQIAVLIAGNIKKLAFLLFLQVHSGPLAILKMI